MALETSSRHMKKQFIAEGEEELLSRRRHIFSFLFPVFWVVLLTLGVVAIGAAVIMFDNATLPFVTLFLLLWSIFSCYQLFKAWIAWRYNFLIITTEKIVIVNHVSFLHQDIHPIHIEDIRSTRIESQFYGIGNCGTLYVNLEEKVEGSSEHVSVSYLPNPTVIVSMIENAIVLKKQRVPVDQGPADQQQKVEDVKEKATKATGKK